MSISLPSVTFRALLILFKVTLDLSYITYVSPVFGYAGFDLAFDSVRYVESWALFLFSIYFINHTMEKPSDFLIFLFLIIPLTPILSLYGLSDRDSMYTYAILMVYFIFISVQKSPNITIPYIKNGNFLAISLSISFILIVMAKMFTSGAIFKINFDLSKVYSFREEVGDTLFTGIWAYFVPWMTKVFTIIILAYSLLKKRYLIAFLMIIFQIILFGITSHKSVALYPVFTIALYLFKDSKNILLLILSSLILLILICLSTYIFLDDLILSSLFVRRVFFVPALLDYQYHDFFSNNGFVYWSNSIFSSFFDYPFNLEADNLIASVYHGRAEMNANTGYVGTSYMNFGFPGMFFMSLFVAFLLKLMDSFSNGKKPVWFYLSFMITPFFALFSSAALLTTLLTHGLGLAFLMAWLTFDRQTK
jgi:hypothetical protein